MLLSGLHYQNYPMWIYARIILFNYLISKVFIVTFQDQSLKMFIHFNKNMNPCDNGYIVCHIIYTDVYSVFTSVLALPQPIPNLPTYCVRIGPIGNPRASFAHRYVHHCILCNRPEKLNVFVETIYRSVNIGKKILVKWIISWRIFLLFLILILLVL